MVNTLADTTTIVNIERMWFLGGDGADIVTGGALDDVLDGNDGADTLSGSGGTDTVNGGLGDDSISVLADEGIDIIDGGAGTDFLYLDRSGTSVALTISLANPATQSALADGTSIVNIERMTFIGGSRADTVTGGSLADILDGGVDTVSDTLTGLAGNDVYVINTGSDNIVEAVGGGTGDMAKASVSYALGAGDNIEFLETTNAAGLTAINLTGNEIAQSITGNAGANILSGGADALADTLIGLGGNDSYVVNSANDIIVEAVGAGTADRVKASVSFVLTADNDIEILSTTNAALVTAINLTGNGLAQTLYGNNGANILNGGIDALKDTLIGYAGNDTYVINSSLDNIIEAIGSGVADRAKVSV